MTLRRQHAQRALEAAATHALQGELVSLVALLGTQVTALDGRRIGRLRDVVVHWTTRTPHPVVNAIVVRVGCRELMIGASWVEISQAGYVRLRADRALARQVQYRSGDVALARDVLDRQVVDLAGKQIVRPADLYFVLVDDHVALFGAEVGAKALIKRLGPRRFRRQVRPDRVIDWASIAGFMPARPDHGHRPGRRSELAGQSGSELELAEPAVDVQLLHPSEIEGELRAAAPRRDESPP